MESQLLESHYVLVVYPVMRNFFEGALSLGVFLVALGMLRRALKTPRFLISAEFGQKALLLFTVMLWVANIAISYDIFGETPQNLTQSAAGMGERDVETFAHSFAHMTMCLIPIEICSAVAIAGIFSVLSLQDATVGSGEREPGLRFELSMLIGLTSLVYFFYVGWWLVLLFFKVGWAGLDFRGLLTWDIVEIYTIRPNQLPATWNMAYHASFSSMCLVLLGFWRFVSSGGVYRRWQAAVDWVGVSLYCLLALAGYYIRFGHYLVYYASRIGTG